MPDSRIKMSHPYGQTPPNVFSDFDWIHRHEKELLDRYGECSIIVYNEQVIGVGDSYEKALKNAEQNLASDENPITPVHQRINNRDWLFSGLFRKKR